ncbi:MAG: MATE family efflux transporter [Pyrinomonadaceae bacterium]
MAFDETATENIIEPAENQPAAKKYDRSIIEGSLPKAVWKIAAPTMLTNAVAGLQGLIDHILIGNLLGYKGNAAMGVSWQIFLVVIVFISSIDIGKNILVARFVGAGEIDKVNRTVYQGLLTSAFVAFAIIAPVGYFAAPALLNLVNAAPDVQAEALPYLRIMFIFSFGMMVYFLTSGALRAAGDAKTPMILGIVMTVLNVILNVVFIRGFGPIPSYGVMGSAIGFCLSTGLVGTYSIYKLWSGDWVVTIRNKDGYAPDWKIIRRLFKFGLPAGFQGIAMNIGGVLLLSFIGSLAESAAAQAAYAVAYAQLFSLITWTSVGLMGAASAITGQNLGAQQPERAREAVNIAAKFAFVGAAFLGIFYFFFPRELLGFFGMHDAVALEIGVQLLRILSFSGILVSVALTYTGGLQGSGDTKSPLFISIISQVVIPLGICFVLKNTIGLQPIYIWLAILAGHFTRCFLSFIRFRQGKWQNIKVDLETTHA